MFGLTGIKRVKPNVPKKKCRSCDPLCELKLFIRSEALIRNKKPERNQQIKIQDNRSENYKIAPSNPTISYALQIGSSMSIILAKIWRERDYWCKRDRALENESREA